MQQMDAEVKQRGMGINPDVMPVQDEADNYAFTPEAAAPEIPAPEQADGEYRVYGPDGEFLMLGEVRGQILRTVKSFFEVK